MLRIAEIVFTTSSEGPGLRTAVWVQGCSIRCDGCCNPEMLSIEGGRELSLAGMEELVARSCAAGVEGVTLLGGEPFDQASALSALAAMAKEKGLGIVAFSGYRLESLTSTDQRALLAQVDMLIDGPYQRAAHSSKRRWVGSENQRIHHLTDRYRAHPDIQSDHSQSIHITYENGELTVSGWPDMVNALTST